MNMKKTVGRRTGRELFRNKKICEDMARNKNFEDFFNDSESNISTRIASPIMNSSPINQNAQRFSTYLRKELDKNQFEASEISYQTNDVNNPQNLTLPNTNEEMRKQRRTVGRRTGATIEVGKRKLENGAENYEDYWTKSTYSDNTSSSVDGLYANGTESNVNKEVSNSFSSTNKVQETELIQPRVQFENLSFNNLNSQQNDSIEDADNRDLSPLIENPPVMHSTPIRNDQNIAISPLSAVERDFRNSLHKTTSFTGIENYPIKRPSSSCLQSNIPPIDANSTLSVQKNQSNPLNHMENIVKAASRNISSTSKISDKIISNGMDLNSCVTGFEHIFEGEEIATENKTFPIRSSKSRRKSMGGKFRSERHKPRVHNDSSVNNKEKHISISPEENNQLSQKISENRSIERTFNDPKDKTLFTAENISIPSNSRSSLLSSSKINTVKPKSKSRISLENKSLTASPKSKFYTVSSKNNSSLKSKSLIISPKNKSLSASPKNKSITASPKNKSIAVSPKSKSYTISSKSNSFSASPKRKSLTSSPKTKSVYFLSKNSSLITSPTESRVSLFNKVSSPKNVIKSKTTISSVSQEIDSERDKTLSGSVSKLVKPKSKKQKNGSKTTLVVDNTENNISAEILLMRSQQNLSSNSLIDSPKSRTSLSNQISNQENLTKSQDTISSTSPDKTEFERDKTLPDTASKSAKNKSKKRKNISENEVEVQVRRSQRNRIPPLQIWRNERRIFQWDGADLVNVEYDAGTAEDKSAINRILKRMEKSNNPSGHKKKTKLKGGSKMLDNSVNAATVQEIIPKISVLNPNTGTNKEIYIHRPYNSLLWCTPSSQDQTNPSFTLTKSISTSDVSFGFIDINPSKLKEEQYSPSENIHFTVIHGTVQVCINNSKLRLVEKDTVIVPAGNTYSIKNLSKTNAILHFCSLKIPIFDHQNSESSD